MLLIKNNPKIEFLLIEFCRLSNIHLFNFRLYKARPTDFEKWLGLFPKFFIKMITNLPKKHSIIIKTGNF